MEYIFGDIAHRSELPPLSWNPDSQNCQNPHMLMTGTSGSGKTSMLLDIVRYLDVIRKHIFIFDLKGDMVIKDNSDNVIGNYIEFTAWNSEYGINPFEFDTGVSEEELKEIIANDCKMTKEQQFKIQNSGPKVQINRIVEMIKKNFLPNMGAGQRDILMYLFADTYLSKGFKYDDVSTWLNDVPNLQDTLDLIDKINSYFNGGIYLVNSEAEDFIMGMHKEIVKLKPFQTKLSTLIQLEAEDVKEDDSKLNRDELEKHIKERRDKISELVDKYVSYGVDTLNDEQSLNNKEWFDSKSIQLKKYETKDAIRTMLKMQSYINALVDSGVFHSKRPPVKAGLNIINISGLDVEIQRFIVDIWLGKVFKSCKIRGTYMERENRTRGDKCDTYVIIDESKLIAGTSRDKNNPYSYLNRIATEARGFGLGIVVAAQSAEHFPPEFLKNFHTQVILSTSTADADAVRKSFGIDKELLKYTEKIWGNGLIKTGRVFNMARLNALLKIKQDTEIGE